ncbi:MAG: Acyl carrier protein [candidate division WWE3 bacterium GW2011_GWC1_41_7]|uniref:Acyl carrier protein n=4 Tax=Katanobacteria TaxID=422282 RepID=A0A0G0X7S0_UNCKA|nr:MAG: Acyl carrier protein [candidate division WWE3 bacterium GW2011_GWB1_41_6]KKS20990.1 MAG: Acyl carrier protein [candidate division WWE3 bacterium GW2011_GWC1_41_7]KKS21742.1 MAG: Acyl carrier protein [candidate division WWE3 bacterium GW2011_GWA1_41_8]OGC56506.1 MAG: hypothetical protein A2976_02855 [candidate division WWE3 bacterium RIFCSPLOWO2_01_FULL_41_9]
MSNYLQIIKELVSERTGLEPSEITKESFFEDDLNVSEMELIDILEELEETYKTDLVEERDNIDSVESLMDILSEKLD